MASLCDTFLRQLYNVEEATELTEAPARQRH
jgi:hypothetical protein